MRGIPYFMILPALLFESQAAHDPRILPRSSFPQAEQIQKRVLQLQALL